MDSVTKLLLERSENEIDLARVIFATTQDKKLQKEVFHLEKTQTFYSGVIAHAYYSIFYAAKAYLLSKGIKTYPPEEHKKAFLHFKKLTEQGEIDKELLKLYTDAFVKAETLLGIFKVERQKRGHFTYQRLAQANKEPAEESLKNAEVFFKHIFNMCDK